MKSPQINIIKEAIIYKLRDNAELMALLNDESTDIKNGNIYTTWVSEINSDLMTYPCLTIIKEGGGENDFNIGSRIRLRFDVWTDESCFQDGEKILDLIREIINKESLIYGNIYILQVVETYGTDDYNFINGRGHNYSIYKLDVMLL